MGDIYLVSLEQTTVIYVEAADEQEAVDVAWSVVDSSYWDTSDDAYVVRSVHPGEFVETEDGPYQYDDLVQLQSWLEAVEQLTAVDPNQHTIFDQIKENND